MINYVSWVTVIWYFVQDIYTMFQKWWHFYILNNYNFVKSSVVRTVYGNSKGFEVKVGMHQGSGLSPLDVHIMQVSIISLIN